MPARILTKLIVFGAAIAALTACSPAVEDPVPAQIKNLAMGANMASVKEMVNGSGGVVTGVSRDKRGPEITWTPTANPYYQTIDFGFTEKDRLYLIRYNLKEASRKEYQGVKNAFFDLYKFNREDPMRMKFGGNDSLLYDRHENSDTYTYFIEITDKKTGNKSIELFERKVSAQDRPPKKPAVSPEASAGQPMAIPELNKDGKPPEPVEKSVSGQDKPQKKSEEVIQESGDQPKTTPEPDKGNESGAK